MVGVIRNDAHLTRGRRRLAAAKEESIRRPGRRPPHLPTQQRQLVAEHDNLELLELSGAEQKKDELKHTPERDVAY